MHLSGLRHEATWKPFARLVVAALICAPFMLLYLLGSNQIGNVYVLMFFKTFLPTFIAGFIIFGVADFINIKLKLLQFADTRDEPLINDAKNDLEV